MIDIYVDQIMTEDLVTVEKSQSLVAAGGVMIDADVKSVVVSEDNRPIGILTSTDFVQAAADGDAPTDVAVADCMTHDIVTTTPDSVIHEAAALMVDHDISHLPVVRNDGRLAGIVTTTDVAAYVSGIDDLPREGR